MARVTLKDLALAAGVSTTTVSHALHGTRHVSPRTRAAIQALAERMGYRPDPVARMLQGQDSLLIGHIVCALIGNPFFAQVARGADHRAQESGFATILACTEEHEEAEARAVDLLLEKRVNGIIFTTPQAGMNVARAVAAGVATVMIERPLAVPGAHAVVVDHRRGFYDLTRLLIDQGHRRLAYIGGDLARQGSEHVERQRLRGFRAAMREAGLAVPTSHLVLVPYGIDAGRSAAHAVLNNPRPPTALVIGSDLLVAGVLQSLYDRGLHVPDDLSVVSYDDTLGAYMAPPLTEAEPPTEEMGRRAVELIVQQCRQRRAQRTPHREQRILLQPHIHVRASTRALDTRELQVVAP
jgi:DNA-binding LacI/PurR family transcriptional regulator